MGCSETRGLGKGVIGGASPDESPQKDVKLGQPVRLGLTFGMLTTTQGCRQGLQPYTQSHSSSTDTGTKLARAGLC